MLLLGNSANPAQFPHLATYVDNRLIQRGAVFLASSTERLAAGGLAGVFSTPLYLAGIWHIFEASKPGGTRWSLPPFLLLVSAFSIAPFVHGSFFYVAEILKTVGQVDRSAQPVLVTLATRATVGLFIAYGVLAVLASVGFAWLTVAIARGKTLYPRWVALANPLVCMLAGVADRPRLAATIQATTRGRRTEPWNARIFHVVDRRAVALATLGAAGTEVAVHLAAATLPTASKTTARQQGRE